MVLGVSLILIAVGAVMASAVHVSTTGFDVHTVGIILLVVGIVGAVLLDDLLGRRGRGLGTSPGAAAPTSTRVLRRRGLSAVGDFDNAAHCISAEGRRSAYGREPRLMRDPELDGFLALSRPGARPRRSRLPARSRRSRRGSASRSRAATTDDLERYLAELRADGSRRATISRRLSALRSFFRHQVLLGARADNPAAELEPPRRRPKLPRTLSPREAERLIEAAAGTTPAGASRRRARRAPLWRRAPGQRGGRARTGRRRPRRAARPLHRQGEQGADRPDRRSRGRGAPALPLTRPPLPRPPPPARALPEREGRPADPRRRLPDPAHARRARPGSSPSASTPTCSATRSRRTCSKEAPTCAPSRRCSATPTSRRPSCTRTSPTGGAARRTSRRTRTRAARILGVLATRPSSSASPPPSRPSRAGPSPGGRRRRAPRGARSCRGAREPFFRQTIASRRTAWLSSAVASRCSIERAVFTAPARRATGARARSAPSRGTPGSRRPAHAARSSIFWRKRNCPIAR